MDAEVSGVGVELVAYHEDTATVRAWYDEAETNASTAVLATLAESMDVDVVDLESLYATLDPGALDRLVGGRDGKDDEVHVSFPHEGHAISVDSHGEVSVSPDQEPPSGDRGRDGGR